MKRIFAVLPTVVVAAGIAGWAVARANFADRVEERARAETQAVRLESQRVARHLVEQLSGADRVVLSRWPEKGRVVESVQDRAWISRLAQILEGAEFTSQRGAALWVSDTGITCYHGVEPVLTLVPLGNIWKVTAGKLSAEFVVDDADNAAMTALVRDAQPHPTSL